MATDNACGETLKAGDPGEIVVRADDVYIYGEKIFSNSAVGTSEITSEQLIQKGAITLADALEFTPGIDMQFAGKGESQVIIRGFEQRCSKVLIDGVPAYEGYFGVVDLSALPVRAVDKIVIEKGAASVLYGANTMGGVINIITRKRMADSRHINVSASAGDYNSRNYAVSHSADLGKFNYYAGYNWSSADGFRMSDDFDQSSAWTGVNSEYHENGGLRESSDYKKQSLNINLGYRSSEMSRANLSISYLSNEHGCPVEKDRYWRFAEWQQFQIGFAADQKIGSGAIMNTRIFYVDHGDELVDDAERTIDAGGKSWFDRSRYDDFSAGCELHFRLLPDKNNLVRFGLNYQKDRNKQAEYNPKNNNGDIIYQGWTDTETYEADTYCLGAEDLMKLTERLFVNIGASYDYFVPLKSSDMPGPGNITNINPQAGAAYNINKGLSLVASIGKKTRFPRMVELYSRHAGGNPDLKAEQTISAEAGIEYNTGYATSMNLSYFHNDIDNLIERIKDEYGNWMYINIGQAAFWGLETELKSAVLSRVNIEAGYSYLHTINKENNMEVACKPRQKINLSFNYDSPIRLDISLYGSYVGKQVQYYNGLDRTITRTIPDYSLLHTRISYRLLSSKSAGTEFFITINNILDVNYDEGNGPMPGRSFTAGFNVSI